MKNMMRDFAKINIANLVQFKADNENAGLVMLFVDGTEEFCPMKTGFDLFYFNEMVKALSGEPSQKHAYISMNGYATEANHALKLHRIQKILDDMGVTFKASLVWSIMVNVLKHEHSCNDMNIVQVAVRYLHRKAVN
ncbi:hypothetical protein [Chakrabartyella piscis]|uniref:hypothetical protein n=1 Tax=Chakrabartyella piscis TaxID=2918914 RepID=UPI002958785F|nr:hypothetical protein [Chakrabartyella piscis]